MKTVVSKPFQPHAPDSQEVTAQCPVADVRFSDLQFVGAGAMGTVFKAYDALTRRHVALKVLKAEAEPARFLREAQLLASLGHRNIVQYVGQGVGPQGEAWLAMEWLDGEDLSQRLDRGPLCMNEVIVLAESAAQALSWMHEHDVIHRDIKPSNLFLVGGDPRRLKLVDFGLGRAPFLRSQTLTGMFMGTLAYMPPEQTSDAKRADVRADVYSLGAVLFECITGVPPLKMSGMNDLMTRTTRWEPPLVHTLRADVPEAFSILLGRMLAVDRERRPQDGGEVLRELRAIPLGGDWQSVPTLRMPKNVGRISEALPSLVSVSAEFTASSMTFVEPIVARQRSRGASAVSAAHGRYGSIAFDATVKEEGSFRVERTPPVAIERPIVRLGLFARLRGCLRWVVRLLSCSPRVAVNAGPTSS